jgi:hypothetical protein
MVLLSMEGNISPCMPHRWNGFTGSGHQAVEFMWSDRLLSFQAVPSGCRWFLRLVQRKVAVPVVHLCRVQCDTAVPVGHMRRVQHNAAVSVVHLHCVQRNAAVSVVHLHCVQHNAAVSVVHLHCVQPHAAGRTYVILRPVQQQDAALECVQYIQQNAAASVDAASRSCCTAPIAATQCLPRMQPQPPPSWHPPPRDMCV